MRHRAVRSRTTSSIASRAVRREARARERQRARRRRRARDRDPRSTPRRGRVSARGRASAREGLGRRGRVARARGKRARAREERARGGGEVVMASVRTLRFDDVADDGDGDAREVATSSDDEDDVGLPVVVGGRRARAGVRRASSAVRAPAESDDEGEEDARRTRRTSEDAPRIRRRRSLRVSGRRRCSRWDERGRMRSSARGNDARARATAAKGSRRWSWSCRWRENSRRRSWRVI